VALAAAGGWALARLGVLANPLADVEAAVIDSPWSVVAGLAVLAAGCLLADRGSAGTGGTDATPQLSGPARSTATTA
jgi:hypothetical protein